MTQNSRWIVTAAATAAAGLAAFLGSHAAIGEGSVLGDLKAGGSATGDISKAAGEVDRIGIDLADGATLTAKFTADFNAKIDLLDPNEGDTTANFGTGAVRTLNAWPATSSGKFHFRIASADGSQGTYTLTASVKWPAKLARTGASGDTISIGLPAGATLKGKIAASPAKSWTPQILSVLAPSGTGLLASAITGKNGVAKLPAVKATEAGTHVVAVGGGTAGGQFTANLTCKAPKVKAVKLALSNGLTPVSYAQDGIGQMLADHACTACHSWATAYATAKQHAAAALPRVTTGQMPVSGAKLTASEIALFRQWIATGMAP